MKYILRSFVPGIVTLIGTTSFGQSLNFSQGYTASWMKIEGMSDGGSDEVYHDNGSYSFTNTFTYKNLNGFNAAIGYEFQLGNRLSLEAGFKYQTRGYRALYEAASESIYENGWAYSETETKNYTYKMNYLDLPIVLNMAILTGDYRVYGRTGIYAGFLTRAKYFRRSDYTSIMTYSSGVKSEPLEYTDTNFEIIDGSLTDEYFTGGLVFGIGTEYKGFYFETNYNIGIRSLAYLDGGMFPVNDRYTNDSYTHDLSFSLGYKIKFKK